MLTRLIEWLIGLAFATLILILIDPHAAGLIVHTVFSDLGGFAHSAHIKVPKPKAKL